MAASQRLVRTEGTAARTVLAAESSRHREADLAELLSVDVWSDGTLARAVEHVAVGLSCS